LIHKILLALTLLLTSCSSTQKSPSLDHSLSSIYGAVEKAMSMGVLKYSENRRLIYSKPFVVNQNDQARKAGYRERGVAKVWILGDIRPYTVETEVEVERAKVTPQTIGREIYEPIRSDKELARKLLANILAQLIKRENSRNVIDDFRPF